MAGSEVKVAIVADNSDLSRKLKQSESRLASFGKAAAKASLAAGAAAAVGIGLLAKASVTAASDAEQSMGATETVFGKHANSIIKASGRAAAAVGLSGNAYREQANVIGALLGNQGVAQDKLARKTKQ